MRGDSRHADHQTRIVEACSACNFGWYIRIKTHSSTRMRRVQNCAFLPFTADKWQPSARISNLHFFTSKIPLQ